MSTTGRHDPNAAGLPGRTAAEPRPVEGSWVRSQVSRVFHDPVLHNTIAIMGTTVVTSVFGYVFWIIVARAFGAEVSGSAAAITSALQATVLIASVGAAAAMIEWLPRAQGPHEWRQRVTAGLVLTMTTASVGGIAVVGVLGFALRILPELATPTGAVLFSLSSVFFAVGILIDYVSISERRGGVLLVRNVILTGLRIPLLFVPIGGLGSEHRILVAWTVASACAVLVSALAFRRRAQGRSLRPTFGRVRTDLRQMASSLVGQHLITVAAMMAGYLLPVLVVARLSASDNAYFYVTWMLGSVFFIISPAISTALFAAGATDPSAIVALVRRCVMISGALLVVPMTVYLLGGGLLLDLFGDGYARHGRLLLVLLTLSAVPDAVTNIAVSVLRATGRLRLALRLNAGMLLLCLVSSWWLLPRIGIVAAGICWLASQSIGAAWVLVAWRRIVRPGAPPQPSAVPIAAGSAPS